jgi:hypothetical protein
MPVLRFRWLTPLYDPLVRLLLPERRFRAALLAGALDCGRAKGC